jgi:hypothetical protein
MYIRSFLVCLFFYAAGSSLCAQTYQLYPDDTINITGNLEDLQTLSIEQHNISSNTIYLKWKKISESVPLLWDASVCDNRFCYTTLVDSGTMNPVLTGTYGFVLLHVTPHVNAGTAVIRYEVWDVASPQQHDTLTFILTVPPNSGVAEMENIFTIEKTFADDNLVIHTKNPAGFGILISDISGKIVCHQETKTDFISVSTASLIAGNYILSLFSGEKVFSKKIVIQK